MWSSTLQPPSDVCVESALVVQQGSEGHVLLAEELITFAGEGSFCKYLDNVHATPFEDLGVEDLSQAHFLCFSQNFQWDKTKVKAFISDFQGMHKLPHDTVHHH